MSSLMSSIIEKSEAKLAKLGLSPRKRQINKPFWYLISIVFYIEQSWLLAEQIIEELKILIFESIWDSILALLFNNFNEFFGRRVLHLLLSGFLVFDLILDRSIKIIINESTQYLAGINLFDFLFLIVLFIFNRIVLFGFKIILDFT